MVGRPCKPDPDVNWLWRTLLPNTPLPTCNMASEQSADFDQGPDRATDAREQDKPSRPGKFSLRRFLVGSFSRND
jgi:hypothetical protein